MNMKKILLSTAVLGAMTVVGVVGSQNVSADAGQGQYKSVDKTGVLHSNSDDSIWTKPYGQQGAEWLGNVKSNQGKIVKVSGMYTDSDTGIVWINFDFNGQSGWATSDVVASYFSYNKTNYSHKITVNSSFEIAKLHAVHSYDNLFTGGTSGVVGAKIAGSVSNHEGEFVRVLNKFNDQNGTKWAEIQLNGENYYVAQDALNYDVHYVRVFGLEDGVKVHLNGDERGAAVWTRPYGLENASYMESVDSIRQNGSREFTVDKYAEVNDQYWLHLKDTGWVISSTANFQTKNLLNKGTGYNRYGIVEYSMQEDIPWNSNTTIKSTYSLAGYDGNTDMNSWYY